MSDQSTLQTFDQLQRYVFTDHHVRGECVQLQTSFAEMISTGQYPTVISDLLGQLMAAASLLTATLKFEGEISIQLQSEGVIKYVAVNGTHHQALRGTARWDGELTAQSLTKLLPNGLLVITITPNVGERYQGVVALEKASIAACIEDYFEQSEQLKTKVVLCCDPNQQRAAGLFLQVLPQDATKAGIDFEHLATLTESVQSEELLNLPATEVLYRLYHQEKVELYQPQTVKFECSCSREKSLNALGSVPKEELLDIIRSDGEIAMHCQYCNTTYSFTEADIYSEE